MLSLTFAYACIASSGILALLILKLDFASLASFTVPARDQYQRYANVTDSDDVRGPYRQNGTTILRGEAVIELTGQLGNYLSAFSYYFVVKTIAMEEFNLNLTLHVRTQGHSQSVSATKNARCFTSFRDLDFDECKAYRSERGEECRGRVKYQRKVLNALGADANSIRLAGGTSNDIRNALRRYADMLRNTTFMEKYEYAEAGWTNYTTRRPFLYTKGHTAASLDLIDEWYDHGIPEYFAFEDGNERCCRSFPYPDEHVFHYRAFRQDLPKKYRMWGGAELIPEKAANILMGHLPNGTSVALVGRTHNKRFRAYQEEFEQRSFRVRPVVDQSGVQDFCFLAHAEAGLWSTDRSTYSKWAAIFNRRLRNATLYVPNYPSKKENKQIGHVHKNKHLVNTIRHPVFNVSEEDVW
mmetsp:Transcript_26350/g.57111  ORF Transcript_26350/g.57111 Transcript_26350/m.57111 type:complete len:411 (+) Transcript_26350:175-1407(+)